MFIIFLGISWVTSEIIVKHKMEFKIMINFLVIVLYFLVVFVAMLSNKLYVLGYGILDASAIMIINNILLFFVFNLKYLKIKFDWYVFVLTIVTILKFKKGINIWYFFIYFFANIMLLKNTMTGNINSIIIIIFAMSVIGHFIINEIFKQLKVNNFFIQMSRGMINKLFHSKNNKK